MPAVFLRSLTYRHELRLVVGQIGIVHGRRSIIRWERSSRNVGYAGQSSALFATLINPKLYRRAVRTYTHQCYRARAHSFGHWHTYSKNASFFQAVIHYYPYGE